MVQVTRKFDDQNAVRNDDAHHHDHAHQGHDVQGGARGEQEQEHAGESWRNSEKNDERILPGGKLRDENQVAEDARQNEADAETAERRTHALDRATKVHADAFGKVSLLDDVIHLIRDRPQVLRFWRNIDIDNAEQLIVVDFGGRRNGFDFDDGVEEGRLGAFHSAQRNLLEVRHRFDGIFGVLRGEHVGVAALRIDPIIRGDHAVGSEGGDDVVYDFLLRKTEEARFFPVNVEFEGRVVDVLGNQHVVYVFELAHGLSKLRSGVIDRVEIVSADLNVNRRRQTKIDHSVDQAAGLEIGAELREFLAQLFPDATHICSCR